MQVKPRRTDRLEVKEDMVDDERAGYLLVHVLESPEKVLRTAETETTHST
jgi:hypothetical protein